MDSTAAKVVVGVCALVVLAYVVDKASRGAVSRVIADQPLPMALRSNVIEAANRITREAAQAAEGMGDDG